MRFSLPGVNLRFGPNTLTVTSADALGNVRERSINVFRPRLESNSPTIALTLSDDTGRLFNDGLTSSLAISGAIDEESGVSSLQLGATVTIAETGEVIELGPADVTSAISGAAFALTSAEIESVLGQSIPDGSVTFTMTATDIYDNTSTPQSRTFDLDRTSPQVPIDLKLTPESDLGRFSDDNITSLTGLVIGLDLPEAGTTKMYVDGVLHAEFLLPDGDNEVTLTGLAAGTRVIQSELVDDAGNVSQLSDPVSVFIDVVAPDSLQANAILPPIGSDSGQIDGTTESNATIFLYRGFDSQTVIAETISAGDGTFVFSDVKFANGRNHFRVVAEDLAGNTIEDDLSIRYDAPDLSAPEIKLSLLNDSGSSDTDRLTKDPSVAGMVDDASRIASFQVSVGDSPFVNTLGSLQDNQFTLDRAVLETIADQRLEDGEIRVRIRATDVVGYASEVAELVYQLDTTRPDTPTPLELDPSNDSGVPGDGVTNSPSLTFFTSTETNTAEVILFEDGEEVTRASSGSDVSLTIDSQPGRHRYVAQSVDAAGNVSFFTAPRFITFDDQFTVPTVGLLATEQRLDLGSEFHTTTSPAALVGIAEPGTRLEILGEPNFTDADEFGRFEIAGILLVPGANNFTVQATDSAGNSTSIDLELIFVDEDGPEIDIDLAIDTGRLDNDRRSQDPTITGTIGDATGVATLHGSLNGLGLIDITSALNEDLLTIDLPILESLFGTTLPDGRHTLNLVATDGVGNESFAEMQFELDRVGPPLDSPPDLMTSSDLGHDMFDNLTADVDPDIRLFAERGALVKYFVDDVFIGEVLSTGVAQYTLPAFSSGTYNITATIEDVAGNVAGPSDPLVLTIDAEPPDEVTLEMLEFHRSKVDPNHTTDAQVNLIGTGEPGSRITMTGQSETPTLGAGGIFFFAADLEVGRNEFVVASEDPAGNVTEKIFVFTRGELLPPTFTFDVTDLGAASPPLISGTLRAENPIVTARLSTDPSFADGGVDLNDYLSGDSFTLTPAQLEAINGAPFIDGDHAIYFQATDSAGRESVPTEVPWTRDTSQLPTLVSSVIPIGDDYRYSIAATAAADVSQRLNQISIPVPNDVLLTDITTPPMWSAAYSPGDNSISFTFDDPDDGISGGTQVIFSFTAPTAPTQGLATSDMIDLADGGASRSFQSTLQVPGASNLVAVTDYYDAPASGVYSADSTSGLFANDSALLSSLESFDSNSVWGAAVNVAADGSFSFDPSNVFESLALNEEATDSFTYSVRDTGGQVSSATVYMTITGRNESPTAVDDSPTEATPSLYTRAGVPVSIDPIDLTSNDLDPDVNDQLSVSQVQLTSSLGAAVTLTGDGIVYDPTGVAVLDALTAGEHLLDTIIYTVSDPHGETSTAQAEVWVQSSENIAPTAAGTTILVTEDGELTDNNFESLLVGSTDSDALPSDGPLAVFAETVTSDRGAAVTLSADGTFVYDATDAASVQSLAPGDEAQDTFAFRVTDGTDVSATATVTLTVSGINDAPTAGDDQFAGVLADGLLTVPAASGLLANDFDVDSPSPLIIDPSQTAETSELGATVTLGPDGAFTYEPGDSLDYLIEGEVVIDTFTYVVLDDRGQETTATVSIEVTGVDDAPVTGADDIGRGFWTVAGQVLQVPASNGVLTNDFDPDSAGNGTILEASFDGFSQYGARVIVYADGSFTYDPTVSATIAQLQADGIDVIDTFPYTVREVDPNALTSGVGSEESREGDAKKSGNESQNLDPPEASSEGVAEVVLRARPSNYSFDLVANGLGDIGDGVSINNLGNVAFQTENSGKDFLYVWSEDTGARSLVPESFVTGAGQVSQPPDSGTGGIPSARFGETVQINDNDRIFAQRQMNALTMLGMPIMGLPIITFAPVALTYAELWNGGGVLDGDKYGSPAQHGVGDSGIANAGLRWGNPQMIDFVFLSILGVLPPLIGFAMTAQFQLVPRIWTLNPVWASAYYTPVNPVWNAFQDPDNFDFNVLTGVSLATSLVPIWFPDIYTTPFNIIRQDTGSVNNAGQSIFVAHTNDEAGSAGLKLVSYGHPAPDAYRGVSLDKPIEHVMLSDTGYSVYVSDQDVTIVDFELNPTSSGDFRSAGSQAAISDTGYVAVAGDGPDGQGVYIVESETGSYTKIVGLSGDGTVDANEVNLNGQDVGSIQGDPARSGGNQWSSIHRGR